ncbi:hypothetical protein XENOCAPTIV_005347 [Xenoophorus captivus]|uniref:Uncharacterized protein n=1 Tax=Xenoophorus captivus TaxID=1517983 RepID=A0ABV0QGM5_9TELE
MLAWYASCFNYLFPKVSKGFKTCVSIINSRLLLCVNKVASCCSSVSSSSVWSAGRRLDLVRCFFVCLNLPVRTVFDTSKAGLSCGLLSLLRLVVVEKE